MKSISTLNQNLYEKRGQSEYVQTTRVNSGSRKTSIMTKEFSNPKLNLQQKQPEVNNTQLQKVSSAGKLLLQKSDQHLKKKRFSSREADGSSIIKQGYLYRQISPKVTMGEDKMNVVFVKELNKYQINNEPTSPKSPKMIDSTLFMHEMALNGVQLKGPTSPPSHDLLTGGGQIKNRIPKSVLSHHQNLIQTSGKKPNDLKIGKPYQNTITYF